MEDLEVTASLPDPLFSLILWRMFVRRPLGICEDMMRLVWIIREKCFLTLLNASEDTISEALRFFIDGCYFWGSGVSTT
jgi:hypothetical protein